MIAWMIECRHAETGCPYWWTGSDFSCTANYGVRFARRVDAELVIAGQGWSREKYVATEHSWLL